MMSSSGTRSSSRALERVSAISIPLLMITSVLIPAFKGDVALQEDSCLANRADSKGSMLIQSASVRERLGIEMSSAIVPTSPDLQKSSEGSASPSQLSLITALAHVSSLLQHAGARMGHEVTNSAIASFKTWHGLGLTDTAPLVGALLLLIVIIGAMVLLVQPFQARSARAEGSQLQGDSQSLKTDMLPGRFDPRAQASSSPIVPNERLQRIPVERASSFPRVSNSPAPIINVPRSQTPPRGLPPQPSRPSIVPSTSGDLNPRASAAGFQFCPELIVPQHCECILVVPLDRDQHSSFQVTDCNGSCVLRVVPQAPTAGRLWRATITSSTGELLAQCCEASYQASNRYAPEFHLLQAGGQLWAKLLHSPNQERYVLNFVNGGVLHFWGNFEERVVNITNETNQLLATTEIGAADFDPNGRYYRLRVAPTADVGLAVCGLLCIGQHMANQQKTSTSF
mmetsp:Transcript_35652/g.56822  ORF Transcript_35652/g.56822 Transcript_35652/m.56822 type:complete len:455 (+) Transcript_35652:63-1427(+)